MLFTGTTGVHFDYFLCLWYFIACVFNSEYRLLSGPTEPRCNCAKQPPDVPYYIQPSLQTLQDLILPLLTEKAASSETQWHLLLERRCLKWMRMTRMRGMSYLLKCSTFLLCGWKSMHSNTKKKWSDGDEDLFNDQHRQRHVCYLKVRITCLPSRLGLRVYGFVCACVCV